MQPNFRTSSIGRVTMLMLIVAARADVLAAQTQPVYEREPFDQLVLTPAYEGQVVDVYPLSLKRTPNVQPGPNDRELRVRLNLYPEREYDIAWKDIAKVRLYEQILLDEAVRLIRAKKFDEAYRHLQTLRGVDARWPGLDQAIIQFLKADASESFRTGRLRQAVALLAEIQELAPGDRTASRGISTIVQRLFDERFERADFRGARGVVDWAARPDHGLDLGAWLTSVRDKLRAHAANAVKEAESKFARGDYREARLLVDTALEVWPGDQGAQALAHTIAAQHPRVVVGVTRAADPRRIDDRHDWASRRVARLLQRDLVEILDYGADGGRYVCLYGDLSVDPSNQSVQLKLTAPPTGQPARLTGYDVARTLLSSRGNQRAMLSAELFSSVRVDDVYQVRVDLTSPVLQPLGLFMVPLNEDVMSRKAYEIAADQPNNLEFERADRLEGSNAESFELAERRFPSTAELMAAIGRGEIDVIDRLSPLQAERIDRESHLTTQRYRFPSQHFLIPNHQRPLMANRTARRAICYAIARRAILEQDLLGGQQFPGCDLLSGPFTLGLSSDDPVAYAVNDQVRQRAYDPSLAITLYAVAQRALAKGPSNEESIEPDEWAPLKLVYADDSLIAPLASTIGRYLSAAGIECQLEAIQPNVGRPEGEWDLWYADVVMTEPIIDINWLIGNQGLARGPSPYLETALRDLAVSTRWTDARVLLQEIHRLVNDELVLIPLWQLTDHLVYRNDVKGIAREPVTLYQGVESWRMD